MNKTMKIRRNPWNLCRIVLHCSQSDGTERWNMEFHALNFLSFDRIAFAHTLVMPDYRYELNSSGYGIYGNAPENGGILEIGFVEKNPLLFTGEDTVFLAEELSVFILPPESRFSVRAVRPGPHRHTSAEFLISSLPASPSENLPKHLVFPYILPTDPENEAIIERIRLVSASRSEMQAQSWFDECGQLMELLRLISARVESLRRDGPGMGSRQALCARAKEYISRHLSEPIRVSDIASSVGVSKNYLSQVFSRCEGQPPVEYINRLKLSHLVTVVRKYGCTLSEAGAQVGICDVNYLSRLFRQYYGMSFTEYMRQNGQKQG